LISIGDPAEDGEAAVEAPVAGEVEEASAEEETVVAVDKAAATEEAAFEAAS
jgi:hypothetical protein